MCDDDGLIRTVIARMAADLGIEVVAETDSPSEAVELVERYAADQLILDLALSGGRGEEVLPALAKRSLPIRTTIFSAYAGDRRALLAAGATAVVDKPDFERLEQVLAAQLEAASVDGERRQKAGVPRAPMPVPMTVSPSGLATPSDMREIALSMRPGDGALALGLPSDGTPLTTPGALMAADQLLEIARITRRTLRIQDRLGTWHGEEVLALLVHGDERAPEAAFARIAEAWAHRSSAPIRGGWAVIAEGEKPAVCVARALAALADAARDAGLKF